jgi:hypothetical protein
LSALTVAFSAVLLNEKKDMFSTDLKQIVSVCLPVFLKSTFVAESKDLYVSHELVLNEAIDTNPGSLLTFVLSYDLHEPSITAKMVTTGPQEDFIGVKSLET